MTNYWYNKSVYYAYILKLSNSSFYTGVTDNLVKRVKAHNKGDVPHTRKFRPVQLIQYSAFKTKQKALEFEKYLKSGSGIAFRNKRLV